MKRPKITADQLVGLVEIAARFDVQKETCHRWRTRRLMPAELLTVSGTPVWEWPAVEEWGLQTGRLTRLGDGTVLPAAQTEGSLKQAPEAELVDRIGEGAELGRREVVAS